MLPADLSYSEVGEKECDHVFYLLGGYLSLWSMLLLLPALLLGIYAQIRVSSTFNRYSEIHSARGLTGRQGARLLLDAAGLRDVGITVEGSKLSDHYDPRSRSLTLSPEVGDSNSLAALGVAAHESGHALQHARSYLPLRLRTAVAPAASLGSNLGFILFFIGLLLVRSPLLVNAGIVLFSAAVLFTLITLPVELDASRRALAQLSDNSILVATELDGARKVLRAAALTYVAAALMAILQLVRLIVVSRSQ
jgi:Zn-dependent membrane protease YugP